ncbi:hypothetical protein PM082_000209 [Marasmius tenuissimus]|nr:hypothetical protein PM082_000209 [Marasmius tenuissimus]
MSLTSTTVMDKRNFQYLVLIGVSKTHLHYQRNAHHGQSSLDIEHFYGHHWTLDICYTTPDQTLSLLQRTHKNQNLYHYLLHSDVTVAFRFAFDVHYLTYLLLTLSNYNYVLNTVYLDTDQISTEPVTDVFSISSRSKLTW